MLEFINNNGVLFSGIFSIIVALISVVVSVVKDNRKNRTDTVRSLRKELELTQAELEKTKTELLNAQSIENAEKNINKSHGSIYYEKLANGKTREICGFCWEKEHIRIPLAVDLCYEEYSHQNYYSGYCNSCKAHCIENIQEKLPFNDIPNENLPF